MSSDHYRDRRDFLKRSTAAAAGLGLGGTAGLPEEDRRAGIFF
jgi:hypothetical protein